MKKKLSLALCIFLLIVTLLVFAGCEDRYNFGDDYVEVTGLRISSANISLSPTGDTSTYQLDVEILPSNATNRLLRYYVPTEYSDYITVSETGLITARKITPEEVSIPVKVVSTTNKKAYLTVNVVVEEATVKSFSFDPDTITLEYNGAGYQLEPIFEPRHAQDGRQLTYVSDDENICTVSPSGLVTPVNAGNATITATATTLAGKAIKGRVSVNVRYAKGQYRLDVSDATPQYNQVIGQFKPIKFNLEVLNDKSNPDIKIYWSVDSARVPEADGQMQYEHTPSGGTTTSYTVKVLVQAQNEPDWEAESHVITLYYPFDGFSLKVSNYSDQRAGYMYGDEGTFDITAGMESIKTYRWYLRRLGETGKGLFVCENPSSIKTLIRKLNLEGDFVLTVVGLSQTGVQLMTKEFEFSATKFVIGDTLLLDPIQKNGGVPPESYNYYLYSCDENGDTVGDPQYIGSSGEGGRFQYALTKAGSYRIFTEAILNGVVAQVDGQNFGYLTDVIKVYEKGQSLDAAEDDLLPVDKVFDKYRPTCSSDIENVNIEAIKSDDTDRLLVRWTPVGGVCAYVVEITKTDGTVLLMDSDTTDSVYFGNNYVIVPENIVTITDTFSLRIKHKGGDYSERYYYGTEGEGTYYFDKVDVTKSSYFIPVNGVTNLYVSNVRELGELLNFVILNQPDNNKYISYATKTVDGTAYKTFVLDFYPAFELSTSTDYYPVDVEPNVVADELVEIYQAILGAQSAFCPAGSYRYDFVKGNSGNYIVTVMIPVEDGKINHTDAVSHLSADSAHYSDTPYGSEYDNYAIDIRAKVRVYDSEQLYNAVNDGYGIIAGNDAVRVLYSHAKEVVYSIIGPEMTDYEKALAFYDYLATTVIYDTELAAMAIETTPDLYRYAGFKLEGVFNDHQAVCDGIAKAYQVLCAIEGIECIRVTGTVNGKNHAWNKINLGGTWMVVDVTNGSMLSEGRLYANHAYFAVSNEEYLNLFPSVYEYGEYPVSDEGKSYYDNAEINGISPTVGDQSELDALINSFPRAAGMEIEIRFRVGFAYGAEEIAARIAAIHNESNNYLSENVIIIGEDTAIITLV